MSSLRTLVITQNLPYPTFAGMDLRNWQNIHGLTRINEVGVLGLHSNDDRRRRLPPLELAFWRASSDPDLSYPLPKKKLEGRAWLLDPLGHPSDLYYSDAAAAEIDEIMGSFNPQIVVMEGLWLHRYISLVKRHRCRLVLDLHAVEAAMFGEIAASTAGDGLRAKLFRNVLPDRVKVIERQAVNAVDQIWLCSEEDACLMKELYGPSAPICVVPNTVDIAHYEPARTGLCPRPESIAPSRRTVIFPAVFQWEPNAAAAQFLIEEVFPDLARVFPDCQLLLVGGLPTPSMMAAAKREPRIVVTGGVPDMLPFFAAATVMAVPLWQGGGTRLKILEGLASNVPIISTRKGAEGLEVKNGTHLLFAENAGEFIAAIKRIWADESLAKNLVSHGMALMTRAYSWDVSDRRIGQAIAALDGELRWGMCSANA